MGIDRVGFSPQLGLTMPGPQTGRQSLAEIPKIWEDFHRQVQKYDQAASGDTFVDRWGQSSGVWGTRLILGELADKHLPTNSLPFHQSVQRTLSPLAQNNISYKQLLGIGRYQIKVGQNEYFKTYRSLLSKEGLEATKFSVKGNFSGFLSSDSRPKLGLGEFWRKTVLGYNAHTITEPLVKRLFYGALSRLVGFGLAVGDIVKNTYHSYENSKTSGHSSIETLKKTLLTFVGQSAKALISWEIATIGFAIGAAAFCVGTIPAILGGVVVGGLFSAIAHSTLSLLITAPETSKSNKKMN